jgi:hypothetical protein
MIKQYKSPVKPLPIARFSVKMHNRVAAIERFSQNSFLLLYLKGEILCYNRNIIVELKGLLGVCKR